MKTPHETRIDQYEQAGYCRHGIRSFYRCMYFAWAYMENSDINTAKATQVCIDAFQSFKEKVNKRTRSAVESFSKASEEHGIKIPKTKLQSSWDGPEQMFCGIPDCWRLVFDHDRTTPCLDIIEVSWSHRLSPYKLVEYGWFYDCAVGETLCGVYLQEDDIKNGTITMHDTIQAIHLSLEDESDQGFFSRYGEWMRGDLRMTA